MTKTERIKYLDSVATDRKKWRKRGAYYHRQLEKYLQYLIPSSSSVIEIRGDRTRSSSQARRCCDTPLAKKLIGFETKVPLEEGFKRTVDWYRENLS